MAKEIQLDIFEEQEKEQIAQKINAENESYQKKKTYLLEEISATKLRLEDTDLPPHERKDYEYDIKDCELKLHNLEESHQATLDSLRTRQRS